MKRLALLLVLLTTAACQPGGQPNPVDNPQEMIVSVIPSPTATKPLTAAPTASELTPVYVPALCTLMGRDVRTQVPAGSPIILLWGWSAAAEEQVKDYIRAGIVVVTFDGVEVQGAQKGGIPYDENAKLHKALWMAEIGVVGPGLHATTYSLTFSEKIFDGFDYYGPGTKNEKQEDRCEIEVK